MEPIARSDMDDELPEEAIADAFAEIDRSVLGAQPVLDPIGLSIDNQREQASDYHLSQRNETGPSSRTLDDLYLNHREIGTGQKFIRVERKDPKLLNGVKISGFLEDLNEKIPMNEFANRFGGGVYYIHVMGPARGYDDDGRPALKTLERMRLELPGQARMPRYDGASPMSQQGYPYGGAAVAGPHPEVEIAKMQMEQRARERADDERRKLTEQAMRAQAMPPSIFAHIEEVGEKRATEVRQVMEENISRLKRENERLVVALEQRDASIQQLREQVLREQSEFSTRLREQESAQTREVRERYEAQLQELRTRHSDDLRKEAERNASEIGRRTEEHNKLVREITERHDKERRDYEETQQRERTRLVEDYQRREVSATNESQRRESSTRDMYESRLTELQRTYEGRLSDQQRSMERETAALRDQTSREVLSIRSMEEGKSTVSKEFANLQVGTYQAKIVGLEHELATVRSQLAEAQRVLNKPVREQIRDAHELAAETGFGGKPEEDGDWKKQAFAVVREVVPEVAKHFGETRKAAVSQQQQAAHAQQAEMARRQQQQMHPQLAPPHQQAQAAQQRRAPYRVPMPGMGLEPPAWGAGPASPFEAHGAPPPAASPVSINFQQEQPAQPAQEAQPKQPASQQQPSAQPNAEISSLLTEEAVAEFAGQLNLAILAGTVSPNEFAAKFVERVGKDVAGKVVRGVDPNKIVDAVASTKDGSQTAIATREGRKYVAELWKETAELTGG